MASGKSLELREIVTPDPTVISEQPYTSRQERRRVWVTEAPDGRKSNGRWAHVPKELQQPAMNVPYTKPSEDK